MMAFVKVGLRFLKTVLCFSAGRVVRNMLSPRGTRGAQLRSSSRWPEVEFCRPCQDSGAISIPERASKRWAVLDPMAGLSIIAAEEFHDIVPPVDYSLIPPWLIFLGVFVSLTIIGLIAWLIVRALRRRPVLIQTPRERALAILEQMQTEIETINPYRFSIRVSDILRRYVTEQFNLPVTRQTSVEFLVGLRKTSPFSEDEKALLEDFLNRCDLIKFARYEATSSDSQLLLEEAIRFVRGGQLATV